VSAIPAASEPITPKRKLDAFRPKRVTIIEINRAKIKDCAIYIEATRCFFSPIELPIIAFVAAPIPTPTAIIVKYIGKDLAIAPMALQKFYPRTKYQLNYKRFEIMNLH